MSDKHAYLIIAHNQFELLKCLLKALDYDQNDIYLHIDKKMKGYDNQELLRVVKKGKLYILPEHIDVKWGDVSQIECELYLLSEATKQEYMYYHLLSGVDFPLKPQSDIHKFFAENRGTEFIQFESEQISELTKARVSKYHILIEKNENRKPLKRILRKIFLSLQYPLDRTRKYNIVFQKGSNWFSITDDLARYVVSQKESVLRMFRYTLCGDEMFLHTIVYNSSFKNSVCDNNYCDNYSNIMYCIDWKRGNPYEFCEEDYDMLRESGMLFARKFNWEKDNSIIKKLMKDVCFEA